jgi:hypothetical protein
MSRMGNASSQRDDLSTTVNRYLLLQVAAGKGPTMSTWMWENYLAGIPAAVCCLEALACLHCWQSLHQAATSQLSPGHITLAAVNRLVALNPAWAKSWKAPNTAALSMKGTSNLTTLWKCRRGSPCRLLSTSPPGVTLKRRPTV